jgi:formate hydrogenlyase transcriptional activator
MSIPASEYQALLEVSESITLHRDLPGLFHDLFQRLPRLVSFDSLSLILHNPERNTMRVHIVEMEGRAQMDVVERLIEDSPSGFVWETQQPLVVADTGQQVRFPEAMASFRASGIKSFCILPLTTAHRRLGSIAFGNKNDDAYGRADLEFFRLIARQVAVAVDNALSQSENQRYQQELAQERNRLRLLLTLNNNVISNLELRALLRAISNGVRGVMHCDYTSVTIPEPGRNEVRVYARNFSDVERSQREEIVILAKNSISAEVMRGGEPLLLDHAALSRFESPNNQLRAVGLQSVCFLPLISRNKRIVGTLNVGSMQENAFDESDLEFLKQVAAQIAIAIDNALSYSQVDEARQQLAEERMYLTEEIQSEYNFEEIVGDSIALRAVLDHVKTVGPTDSTVLILGETGTGKELIARAIHSISSRRERTFVKVNCAAIPLGLLESELFGHEKGAFTGAISQKIGRFELAHEGTLFLDEIGDIPLELQPKLLRVLQEQEFERLGSTRTIRVKLRMIAATSQDLPAMVADRSFRSDLYYRLNVFPITLPPLREREGDVPLLARYFVDKYARQMNKRIDTVAPETMEMLTQYHWPGNLRELQNFIERAVILTRGRTLTPPLSELQHRAGPPVSRLGTLAEGEREHIMKALAEANWVLGGPGGAAERLGLKRTTLFYKMRRLGITRPTGRGN